MASVDLRGTRTLSPGDGNTRPLPVDREGNLYVENLYFYDQSGVRKNIRATAGAGGSLPLQVKPFQYYTIIEPSPPWNSSIPGIMKAYTGGAPEHLYFYAPSDINNSSITVRYLVNNVNGRVFINLSSLLEGWQTYGGGVRFRLQHTNASNVTVDIYTFLASYANSDTIYTDNDTVSSVGLQATFTGRDTLTLSIDGSGNTGLIKYSFFGISISGV